MAIRELAELVARVADLERRVAGMVRHGTVAEVAPAAGRMRLNLGPSTAGGDFLSPWMPYAQTAGALRVHTPPSVGQQFTAISPTGDPQQAVALPLTWSDQIESPSASGEEHVLTFGDVTATLTANGITFAIGGMTATLTAEGLAVDSGNVAVTSGDLTAEGGVVEHNGTDIGDTHRHEDVATGPGVTGVPVT